jgi:predicted phage terminase large subunit-like protein
MAILDTLPSLVELEAEKLRRSFYQFVKASWHLVEPETPFVDGWHIRAITQYLQALDDGRIPSRNLIINVPPRHMKSLLVNVFFPAWVWTRKPYKKFLFFSYSEMLTVRDSMRNRELIGSAWYQERFNVQVDPRNDTKAQFDLLQGGHRYSFGTGGSIAGQGGDYLAIDDPLEISKANSKIARDAVNYTYDNAISMRGNDPKTVKKIIIMQRLHEDDLVGHILGKNEEWEQLILPAEYEGERFKSSIGFVDPRTQPGELLWPERFGPAEITRMKDTLSEAGVAGQLQQRPAPLLGNIFKRDWFSERYEHVDVVARYISWDTAASIEDTAAYSSGIVGELTSDYRLFIRDVYRERMEFPQLQYRVEALADKYDGLNAIIIEYKSSGIQVVQSLRQTSSVSDLIVPFNPKGDKIARAYEAAKWAEKGMVILPPPSQAYPWMIDFEEELFNYPNSRYADQVDALAQLTDFLSHYLAEGLEARNRR